MVFSGKLWFCFSDFHKLLNCMKSWIASVFKYLSSNLCPSNDILHKKMFLNDKKSFTNEKGIFGVYEPRKRERTSTKFRNGMLAGWIKLHRPRILTCIFLLFLYQGCFSVSFNCKIISNSPNPCTCYYLWYCLVSRHLGLHSSLVSTDIIKALYLVINWGCRKYILLCWWPQHERCFLTL